MESRSHVGPDRDVEENLRKEYSPAACEFAAGEFISSGLSVRADNSPVVYFNTPATQRTVSRAMTSSSLVGMT